MSYAVLLSVLLLGGSLPQPGDHPNILVVTAHPDDEAMFAATIWKTVREYGGSVDLALITDGAGGYRFSTLAEPIYGLNLTDPEVARTSIPAIRKRELMAGGEVVGIRNYFFFDQPDEGKILDVDSVFTELWDSSYVRERLTQVIEKGDYDLVLTFLPVPSTHAHHKGAALLALEVVNSLPAESRPTIVGSMIGAAMAEKGFRELSGYPLSRITSDAPLTLDREQPLGLDGRLDYQIVVNWLIAEHKSQGTMQTYMNAGRFERFWFYALNSEAAIERARETLEAIGLVTQ